MKSVIAKGGKAIMTTEEVKEDAPANAVGDGSAVAMPPAHEPGVHVKKRKNYLGLLKREDYNRIELENVINKICSNQEIEENQIKPIVNNIKSKKEKGTYTEQFGMRAFRYVVDTEITETVSEEYRNKIASSLLTKYESWSQKYKQSIDCDNPKGFSQKAHCAGKKKSFKEMREYVRGFGTYPGDTMKPMASLGGAQVFS